MVDLKSDGSENVPRLGQDSVTYEASVTKRSDCSMGTQRVDTLDIFINCDFGEWTLLSNEGIFRRDNK
jgi:hypothetical protein